jgi:hypothetical protein
LNSAFDLWRPLLGDRDLSKVPLSEKANLKERGGKFVELETMYDEFVVACLGAMDLLTPTLSVWDLKEEFEAADHWDPLIENFIMTGLMDDQNVVESIANALNASGGIGRGRANRTANEGNNVVEEDILE